MLLIVAFTFYEQTPRCTDRLRNRTQRQNKTEEKIGFRIFSIISLISLHKLFWCCTSHIKRMNTLNGPDLLQTIRRKALVVAVLDDLVGVHDDRDEQGEDDVDEEADEEVEVDSAAIDNEQDDGDNDDYDDDIDTDGDNRTCKPRLAMPSPLGLS